MTPIETFLWIVAGVLLSIVINPAIALIYPPQTRSLSKENVLEYIKPYILKFLASLVIAFALMVIINATGTVVENWWVAVLVGFGANKGVDILWQLRSRN